jgi:hypothetical protein
MQKLSIYLLIWYSHSDPQTYIINTYIPLMDRVNSMVMVEKLNPTLVEELRPTLAQ